MTATFQTVGSIVTGLGASAQIGELAAALGGRALLVTGGKPLREFGITQRLAETLSRAGVEVTLFEQVEPEPALTTVDAGREVLRDARCDVVVAAGGGSAMDAGKAIAALGGELAPTAEYFSGRAQPERGLPCIAAPTTAGTGAEVTPSSILTDPETGMKLAISGQAFRPAAAVVDPELTVSCPRDLTASAGIDALTQAIESYLSRDATPITDGVALHGIELVWLNILAAYQHGEDMEAREALAYGALMGGMALANAGMGAVHAMAHSIGARYHLAHGVVCGALLAPVLRFNQSCATEKYGILTEIFSHDPAEAVEYLLASLAMPAKLSGYGLDRADFDAIADESLATRSVRANPRDVGRDDIADILECLL